jgi:prepilin-type N-terminal cleavage/methylation domain-containing protein
MKTGSNNKGFTIVELMIATVVFAMVLLLCSLAIVQVGKMFYKGTTINRTQDTARRVADDVSQAIQFGVSTLSAPVGGTPRTVGTAPNSYTVNSWCLGEVRYSFVTDRSLGSNPVFQSRHVLWKDRTEDPACTPLNLTQARPIDDLDLSQDGEEMVGSNMRIPVFDLTPPSNGVWSILIRVAYGDEADLFEGTDFERCIGSNAGGQFCAVSTISTNAVKRL